MLAVSNSRTHPNRQANQATKRVSSPGLLLIGAITLTMGCATRADFFLDDNAPSSQRIEKIVFLPMNFSQRGATQFPTGVERLDREIAAQLTAAGFEVERLSLSWAKKQWNQTWNGVTESELEENNYADARQDVARRTLARSQADVVVMATLLVRQGRYAAKKLRWDGVKRDAVIVRSKSAAQTAMITGLDHGTSIRISLFDETGKLFFERFVGLEPIYSYEFNDAFYWDQVHNKIRKKLRADLFETPEILTEGVAMAFEPWLVVEDASPQP